MAQNVTIAGASYSDVPSIVAPKTGGGTALFVDVSPTTATASDVASGKVFFAADGTQSVGTSSGGGGTDYLSEIFNGSITHYENDTITVISKGARAFENQTNLVSVSFPELTEIKAGYLFNQCTALVSVNMPKLKKSSGLSIFSNCSALTSIVLPSYYNSTQNYVMQNCTALISADFGSVGLSTSGNIFNQHFFNGCTSLNTIILRANDRVQKLGNVNTFNNTSFASGGTGGTIYIPKALYDHLGDGGSLDYKSATNWSTVNGYGTITWAKIEGSQYENYYADGTPIT